MLEMETRPLIYDLDEGQLVQLLKDWGEPAYRALQVWQGLYRQLWNQPAQFTNLPAGLRHRLGESFSFEHLQPVQALSSADGETCKNLFHLPDHQPVEAVLMYYGDANGERQRRTLCISTQAGCAMGCVFCATGQMGFRRHLSSGEIVEQVLFYARQLQATGERVTNIVIMGMGEPFHNYEATMQAIDRLNHSQGFNFGERRFTVSTVGLIPGILRFAAEKRQVNLAISLHAADDELRSLLLPINRKYPLEPLLEACREYVLCTNRRITFEWALIQNVNDGPEQARRLAQWLKGLLCHVNVIPLNPTRRYSGAAATRQRAEDFKAELERNGIPCTIRVRRGVDISAGCGQLADQAAH